MEEILEQRMYCLTLYNISPIQQGIQSAHAIVEYAQAFSNTKEYQKWAGVDKTIIILNGGSSVKLKEHFEYLLDNQIVDMAFFKEPDLFNGVTAFCFLVDERIWDRKKYPDHAHAIQPVYEGGITPSVYYSFDQAAFIESIGGEKNHLLKLFLEPLRKA